MGCCAHTDMPLRDGNLIRVTYNEQLPKYCLWCAKKARHSVRKTFYWHSPWLYLLLLFGAVPYIIIAVHVREKMVLDVPLCGKCFEARRKRARTGTAVRLGSLPAGIVVGVVVAGIARQPGAGIGLGFLITILMLFVGAFLATERLLVPTHINSVVGFGTFRGASPNFLRRLESIDD